MAPPKRVKSKANSGIAAFGVGEFPGLTIMDDGKDQKDGNLGSSSPAATENRMPSPDGPYVMASWISNDHGIISRAKQDAESTTRGRGRGSGEGTSCTCCNIM